MKIVWLWTLPNIIFIVEINGILPSAHLYDNGCNIEFFFSFRHHQFVVVPSVALSR